MKFVTEAAHMPGNHAKHLCHMHTTAGERERERGERERERRERGERERRERERRDMAGSGARERERELEREREIGLFSSHHEIPEIMAHVYNGACNGGAAHSTQSRSKGENTHDHVSSDSHSVRHI